jgi:hypothetical protein
MKRDRWHNAKQKYAAEIVQLVAIQAELIDAELKMRQAQAKVAKIRARGAQLMQQLEGRAPLPLSRAERRMWMRAIQRPPTKKEPEETIVSPALRDRLSAAPKDEPPKPPIGKWTVDENGIRTRLHVAEPQASPLLGRTPPRIERSPQAAEGRRCERVSS